MACLQRVRPAKFY